MSKFKRFFKDYGFIIVCACLISSTFIFSYKVCMVTGESMVPTLKNGEILVIKTNTDKYNRYDIAVFNNEKTDGNYIKRIIGLPGETLYIENNVIYVNGKAMPDEFNNIEMQTYGQLQKGVTLAQDEYFFMGDNRKDSYDCRQIGPVNVKDIKGKVTFSISNMNKIETKGEKVS